ncbi:MAG TPA: hypothetical protein VI431_17675 [Candidatus Acidoferrum sp.]
MRAFYPTLIVGPVPAALPPIVNQVLLKAHHDPITLATNDGST